MRLTLSILGLELDLTIGRPTVESDDGWVDCGATTSYPVGFVRPEIPWDDDAPIHYFDPPSEGEDT